jgi:hypothetical protein
LEFRETIEFAACGGRTPLFSRIAGGDLADIVQSFGRGNADWRAKTGREYAVLVNVGSFALRLAFTIG